MDWISSSSSLIVVDGPKTKRPADAKKITKKLAKALNVSMNDHDPRMRGLVISTNEKDDEPQLIIQNKDGNDLTDITIRDYTNQEFTVESKGKSFASDQVKLSLDIVDSSAVEYVDNFLVKEKKNTNFQASGGGLEIVSPSKEKITIKTKGLGLADIEKAIARETGGKLQTAALVPNPESRDTRNIKPFDGGEVRFPSLNEKSLTIKINDPSLGIITRFQFPVATSASVGGSSSNKKWIFIILILAGIGGYLFYARKPKEDGTDQAA